MSNTLTFIADIDCIENWQQLLSLAPEYSVDIRTSLTKDAIHDSLSLVYIVRWPQTGVVGDVLCEAAHSRRIAMQNVICVTEDLPHDAPLHSVQPSIVRPDIAARDLLVVARLLTNGYSVSTAASQVNGKTPLSPREYVVLEHIAAGQSNKTIASKLRLSQHTIRVHVQNILRKLGVSNRTEAALCFIRKEVLLRGNGDMPFPGTVEGV